jgi:SM-20-related protein
LEVGITQTSPETSRLALGLLTADYVLEPHFLSAAEVTELKKSALLRRAQGRFQDAGVGRGAQLTRANDVRRDQLSWLEASSLSTAEASLWARLEELKAAFNRELRLGLWELEAHFAIYPPGGFYRRHLDRFRDDDARVISIVLYLNEAWKPTDGGELRLFNVRPQIENSSELALEQTLLIEPRSGSLVCFLSDSVEHEVLESFDHERFSIAGWFRRRA